MPAISAAVKVEATKGYGATVYTSGSTSVEREEVAAKVVADTGARLVPPYDHPDIILGQGTMGLELQAQFAAASRKPGSGRVFDAVIAPCGGGGMLSGVALAFSESRT